MAFYKREKPYPQRIHRSQFFTIIPTALRMLDRNWPEDIEVLFYRDRTGCWIEFAHRDHPNALFKALVTQASERAQDPCRVLRARRKALAWTLSELAARVGSDKGTLSKIERGRKKLGVRMALRLASVLEIAPESLLSDRAMKERAQAFLSEPERSAQETENSRADSAVET